MGELASRGVVVGDGWWIRVSEGSVFRTTRRREGNACDELEGLRKRWLGTVFRDNQDENACCLIEKMFPCSARVASRKCSPTDRKPITAGCSPRSIDIPCQAGQ